MTFIYRNELIFFHILFSGMHSMATANGLVCVPALESAGGPSTLRKGEKVEAIILGNIV